MTRLHRALSRLARDLNALGYRWALIGGLAVAARAEARMTRDVDVVLATRDDAEAERVVAGLLNREYRVFAQLEHTEAGRLGGIRLLSPTEPAGGLVVDLLFASSGIEPEIVAGAEVLSLMPGVRVPVARTGDLIALKVLAHQPEDPDRRPHDIHDALALIAAGGDADLEQARRSLALITRRGFHRGRNLEATLEKLLARRGDPLE